MLLFLTKKVHNRGFARSNFLKTERALQSSRWKSGLNILIVIFLGVLLTKNYQNLTYSVRKHKIRVTNVPSSEET